MRTDAVRRYAPGCGCTVAAIAYLALRYGPIVHGGDFLKFFYTTGREVLRGHLRYALPRTYTTSNSAIFRYPPFAAEVLAAFAWMSMKDAAVAWWVFGVLLLLITAVTIANVRPANRDRRPVIAGVALLWLVSFAPLAKSMAAQIDVWIVALVAVAFALSRRGPRMVFLAGVLLGVAASIKVYPVLTLAVIVAARPPHARALIAGALCSIAGGLLIPLATLGTAPISAYWHVLESQDSPILTAFPFAFGFLSIAYRALISTPFVHGSAHLSPGVVKALFVAFVVGVLALVGWCLRRRRPLGMAWSLALIVTVVCSPFLEIQHLAPLVLVPLLLVLDLSLPLMAILGACAVCGIVGALPLRVDEVVSVIVAAALAWNLRESIWRALVAATYVLLATPAFLNVSSFWGVPMSLMHVALGSAEYVLCLLLLALILSAPYSDRGITGSRWPSSRSGHSQA